MPLSNSLAWCPSCDICLIPFYFPMEWLLDRTEVKLPVINSCLIIMILFGSVMLNFWLFINGFINLAFVLTIYIGLHFMIFRFDCLKNFYLCLGFAYPSSIFNFSSWILADCLISRNSASAKCSAILSFSCKALLSFDDLLEDELGDDFLLEECLEVTLLDLDNYRSFLSWSGSLIQLWILFLNGIIFSFISWNQSSSCSCISRGSKELYFLCTSINILNTPSIWSICCLTASIFLTEYRSSSTALDFVSNLECSFLLLSFFLAYFFSSQVLFQPVCF